MIDEAELRELLAEAAAHFEVPVDGPARVLAAAEAPAEPKQRVPRLSRPRLAIPIGAALVALVGIFALGTLVGTRHTTPNLKTASGTANGSAGSAGPAYGTSAGSMGATSDAGSAAAGAEAGPGVPAASTPQVLRGSATVAGGAGVAAPAPPASAPTPDSAKVIKTGSIQIEVRKGAVGPTMTRLTSLATGFGGYVADSKTAEGADNPTGSVTLRVPANTFENLVASVRSLGTVRSLTSHGQDVTAQYTDLQAKLAALTATRDQFLTILRKATAIGDILAVQDRITQTQTEIDQLQGQLKLLDDQTSYAALSVDVAQHGNPVPGPPASQSGLSKALHDARHGFTNGVEAIIGHSGTALLLLLIAAAAVVAVRFSWPRLRRRFV